jgi:AAA15 family ATPase/GTPase
MDIRKMNALFGPNNAGKLNIIRALSAVLGDQYPMSINFEEMVDAKLI